MTTETTTPTSYAQQKEDIGICGFIQQLMADDKIPKSFQFLDIGANDGITFSNTHLLTQVFDKYVGFFVEPNPEAFKRLKALYKPKPGKKHKHKFFDFAIGTEEGKMTLHTNGSHLKNGDTGLLSTLNPVEKERWKDTEEWTEVSVDVKPYPFSKEKFDFISIDAEGLDEAILVQIDLSSTYLLCIEWNSKLDVKAAIVAYVTKFGMVQVAETTENLIFMKSGI